MIKHIVMWTLHDSAEGATKAENIKLIKQSLSALIGKIPGLLHLEVGENFADSPAAADLVLYSELESREALAVYQQHPDHVAVAQFIGSVTASRQVVDYDC